MLRILNLEKGGLERIMDIRRSETKSAIDCIKECCLELLHYTSKYDVTEYIIVLEEEEQFLACVHVRLDICTRKLKGIYMYFSEELIPNEIMTIRVSHNEDSDSGILSPIIMSILRAIKNFVNSNKDTIIELDGWFNISDKIGSLSPLVNRLFSYR